MLPGICDCSIPGLRGRIKETAAFTYIPGTYVKNCMLCSEISAKVACLTWQRCANIA